MKGVGLDAFALQVATLGGVGRSRIAPGTMGTLASLPVCYLVMQAGLLWHLATLGIVIILGTWAAHRAAIVLEKHDPKEVVVDEMAGMLLTMVFVSPNLSLLLLGFLAFRLFDIWKPWPVNWIDRTLPGGWGIMADDLAAGVYAWVLVMLSTHWIS